MSDSGIDNANTQLSKILFSFCQLMCSCNMPHLFGIGIHHSFTNSLPFIIARTRSNGVNVTPVFLRLRMFLQLEDMPASCKEVFVKRSVQFPRLTVGSPYTSDVEANRKRAFTRLAKPEMTRKERRNIPSSERRISSPCTALKN